MKDNNFSESLLNEFIKKELFLNSNSKKYTKIKLNDNDTDELRRIVLNGGNCSEKTSNEVKIIIKKISMIQKKYSGIIKRSALNNCISQSEFVKWWIKNNKNNGHHCYYCNASEQDIYDMFSNALDCDEPYEKGKIHKSKSNRFNTYQFEIDKKNPNGNYEENNMVFACTLCNNAKSDMIESNDFRKYIGKGIKKYINNAKR